MNVMPEDFRKLEDENITNLIAHINERLTVVFNFCIEDNTSPKNPIHVEIEKDYSTFVKNTVKKHFKDMGWVIQHDPREKEPTIFQMYWYWSARKASS